MLHDALWSLSIAKVASWCSSKLGIYAMHESMWASHLRELVIDGVTGYPEGRINSFKNRLCPSWMTPQPRAT